MPITVKEVEATLEHMAFAVRLPAAVFQSRGEPEVNPAMAAILHDTGVVGTILIMRKSLMIWFGWGKLELEGQGNLASTGQSRPPPMGPLVVAMPRTQYQGAFSAEREASSTKLVGSDAEDEELLCRQMASRLSTKLGVSVLVSGSLAKTPGPSAQGLDQDTMQHRAAALAEQEIYRLLKDRDL